jgi:glycerophosphoryl diester phosphodiesterase
MSPLLDKRLLVLVGITLNSSTAIAAQQTSNAAIDSAQKIVIAHRGASGYLPEHSLAAKQLAYEMGADYIEQDLVLTKDNRLIVLHDIYLDRVTDVAVKYEARARPDGRYYAIDFTWDEIATLKRTERFKIKNDQQVAVYKNRTPLWKGDYKVHLFEQELALIQKLNLQTGQDVGIYPEIKAPSFHRHEGKDISPIVLKTLTDYGYNKRSSKVYLQSFDAIELQRIRKTLLEQHQMDIKLVQLIAQTRWGITKVYADSGVTNYNYDWMLKAGAMQKIAQYAQGIGPHKGMLVKNSASADNLQISPIIASAHKSGLFVHPYTFRSDESRKPNYASSFQKQLAIFYFKVGVDGLFTDFPDVAVKLLKSKGIE